MILKQSTIQITTAIHHHFGIGAEPRDEPPLPPYSSFEMAAMYNHLIQCTRMDDTNAYEAFISMLLHPYHGVGYRMIRDPDPDQNAHPKPFSSYRVVDNPQERIRRNLLEKGLFNNKPTWTINLTDCPFSPGGRRVVFDIEANMNDFSYPSVGGAWLFDADGDSLVKKRADRRPFVNVGTIGHVDNAPVKFKGNLHIKL